MEKMMAISVILDLICAECALYETVSVSTLKVALQANISLDEIVDTCADGAKLRDIRRRSQPSEMNERVSSASARIHDALAYRRPINSIMLIEYHAAINGEPL